MSCRPVSNCQGGTNEPVFLPIIMKCERLSFHPCLPVLISSIGKRLAMCIKFQVCPCQKSVDDRAKCRGIAMHHEVGGKKTSRDQCPPALSQSNNPVDPTVCLLKAKRKEPMMRKIRKKELLAGKSRAVSPAESPCLSCDARRSSVPLRRNNEKSRCVFGTPFHSRLIALMKCENAMLGVRVLFNVLLGLAKTSLSKRCRQRRC